jgi:hypothetical protein
MAIERRKTTEYPIRYSAFDCPRVLFVAEGTSLKDSMHNSQGGKELAAYHEPVQNRDYPALTDGIYAEICNFQGKQYLAMMHATQPWKGRAQKTEHQFFDDFLLAIAWTEDRIPVYQKFISGL